MWIIVGKITIKRFAELRAVVVYTTALFFQIKRQEFIPHLFNLLIDGFLYVMLIFINCLYVDKLLLIVFISIIFFVFILLIYNKLKD